MGCSLQTSDVDQSSTECAVNKGSGLCKEHDLKEIRSRQKKGLPVAICTDLTAVIIPLVIIIIIIFPRGSRCPLWGQSPGSFFPVFQRSSAYEWMNKRIKESLTFTCHSGYLWILDYKGWHFFRETHTNRKPTGLLSVCLENPKVMKQAL